MTEQDIAFIVRVLERLELTVKEGAEVTQEIINQLVTDVAVMKGTLTDIKKEVFGNGKDGLTTRMTKTESKVCSIEEKHDDIVSADAILHTKFRKLEEKIWKWTGIVLGINLTLGVVFTIVTHFLEKHA